jgi:hypothetical protein
MTWLAGLSPTLDDARWIAPLIYLGVALLQAVLLHTQRRQLRRCTQERIAQSIARDTWMVLEMRPALERAWADGYSTATSHCTRDLPQTGGPVTPLTRSPN